MLFCVGGSKGQFYIKNMRVIISGGGTAGHIYPALAVADELRARGAEILFVGALGRMEMERVPARGYKIVGLPIAGIKRSLSLSNLTVPIKMLRSMRMARNVIRGFRPDVVVGFGGYASAPILRAAQGMKVPTVIQEQNSFAGLTNRMLARRAKRVCVAYAGMERFFDSSKLVLSGNPVNRSLVGLQMKQNEAYEYFGLDSGKKTVLVMGGSLGTRTLNGMMVENLKALGLRRDVQYIWQTGRYYEAELAMLEVPGNVRKMAFVERMDYAYSVSDVVICRSGASTVSEVELLGKVAIFVPSPNVAEDHQTFNARALVDCGAALMVRDDRAAVEALPLALELLGDTARCAEIGVQAAKLGRADAAAVVADVVCGCV